MQLEEGEIEDDSSDEIDPYTPLERPSFIHAANIPVEKGVSDEDINNDKSSNEDSDSDPCTPKQAKIRRKMPAVSQTKKKYTIWCRNSNDQLSDYLCSVGMQNPENDRNVENYVLPNMFTRKRKIPIRKADLDSELQPLELSSLETSELNTYDEVASDIASKLKEPNKGLVLRIVVIVGKEKAIEIFNETKEIEKNGGMLILNNSRRRTSGGIFIFLIRNDNNISDSQKNEIFEESKLKTSLFKQMCIKKKKRKHKNKEAVFKMNEDKACESGQEILSNPPPSPEPCASLPELPLRRDLVEYDDIASECNLKRDLAEYSEVSSECNLKRDLLESDDIASDISLKRDVVEYDDIASMDLIYD